MMHGTTQCDSRTAEYFCCAAHTSNPCDPTPCNDGRCIVNPDATCVPQR